MPGSASASRRFSTDSTPESVDRNFKRLTQVYGRAIERERTTLRLIIQDRPFCHRSNDQRHFHHGNTAIIQTLPIKIHITPTEQESYPPEIVKLTSGTSYIFHPKYHLKIASTYFRYINGNVRDEVLSPYFEDKTGGGFCFVIKNNNVESIYIPPKTWQRRFSDCVTKGLDSILNKDTGFPTTDTHALSKIAIAEPKTHQSGLASCHQFAIFMNHGETHLDAKGTVRDIVLPSELEDYGLFTPLAIFIQGSEDTKALEPIHEFIHIGHRICIGKIGTGFIFAHSIEETSEMYKELYNTPSIVLQKRDYQPERLSQTPSKESYVTANEDLDQSYESSDSDYEDAIG